MRIIIFSNRHLENIQSSSFIFVLIFKTNKNAIFICYVHTLSINIIHFSNKLI